jgi:hypothetical protein
MYRYWITIIYSDYIVYIRYSTWYSSTEYSTLCVVVPAPDHMYSQYATKDARLLRETRSYYVLYR